MKKHKCDKKLIAEMKKAGYLFCFRCPKCGIKTYCVACIEWFKRLPFFKK